jgi:hypothetical protein
LMAWTMVNFRDSVIAGSSSTVGCRPVHYPCAASPAAAISRWSSSRCPRSSSVGSA